MPEYQHLFDVSKPVEFLDKELQNLYPEIANLSDVRFVDKLVKVFTPDGDEKWILIHIEVQGYYDKDFAERMYTYFRRIQDSYGRPVTAVAILPTISLPFAPVVMNIALPEPKIYLSSIRIRCSIKAKRRWNKTTILLLLLSSRYCYR